MTVTINEKQYDETKLDDASKIAIVRDRLLKIESMN